MEGKTMQTNTTVPRNMTKHLVMPEVTWGFYTEDVDGSTGNQIIAALADAIRRHTIDSKIKRVRIYGTCRQGAGIHPDQRYLAQCSTRPAGLNEGSALAIICHNDEQGWYIAPTSLHPR